MSNDSLMKCKEIKHAAVMWDAVKQGRPFFKLHNEQDNKHDIVITFKKVNESESNMKS